MRTKMKSRNGHDMQPPSVWVNDSVDRAVVIAPAIIYNRTTITDDENRKVEVDITSRSRLVFTVHKIVPKSQGQSKDQAPTEQSTQKGMEN